MNPHRCTIRQKSWVFSLTISPLITSKVRKLLNWNKNLHFDGGTKRQATSSLLLSPAIDINSNYSILNTCRRRVKSSKTKSGVAWTTVSTSKFAKRRTCATPLPFRDLSLETIRIYTSLEVFGYRHRVHTHILLQICGQKIWVRWDFFVNFLRSALAP